MKTTISEHACQLFRCELRVDQECQMTIFTFQIFHSAKYK